MKSNTIALLDSIVWVKKIRKALFIILIILVIIMFVVPIIIIDQATQKVTYQGNAAEHPLQDIYYAEDFGLKAKEMTLTTEDGLKVWASEVFTPNPKAVIIYLTGIRQPSVTYFYGHSQWLKEKGYASILLEVRGHGSSDGEKVCLGYKEVSDVKAVVDYIKDQKKYEEVPIIVHGVSMGGAVAINSFGTIGEIDGLIAMSTYSRFEDVVYDTMRSYNIPGFICGIEKSITHIHLQIVFGSEAKEMTPIDQIKNIDGRSALLIASTGDTEVLPDNMGRLLKEAPETCEWWLRDSLDHFIIQDCDFKNVKEDEEYCNRILSFLERIR
ncbi:alpha/beta hydrolase [Maledivibacter halophilus]|uniref:Serine aminopeptidase S33 domain-containing protein n=1 Tax=Maledivibacter halophilus TaxID=36842 RepID=A0A1T5M2S4_9FIRM|nr:alpha/beta fold hydrolase [Maledivibacter halophilus]SKC82159.1 hypothetical protein SAMN02194393_03716 [Maledivibacter halophilus]